MYYSRMFRANQRFIPNRRKRTHSQRFNPVHGRQKMEVDSLCLLQLCHYEHKLLIEFLDCPSRYNTSALRSTFLFGVRECCKTVVPVVGNSICNIYGHSHANGFWLDNKRRSQLEFYSDRLNVEAAALTLYFYN